VQRSHVQLPREAPLSRVPVVLDGVVCAARQQLGDLSPPVAVHAVSLHEHLLFLSGPCVLLDGWVQLVVPPGRERSVQYSRHK
jgi:hypothetical protein